MKEQLKNIEKVPKGVQVRLVLGLLWFASLFFSYWQVNAVMLFLLTQAYIGDLIKQRKGDMIFNELQKP